ncbi:DUF2489 domain-containing protein [Hymenobacter siberiensis]|jgi:hypothetical protein|uniref:DUF2489 domain-containing protein n=1 Tax=Hymenobacter siberiensis TaxID=2848396 RepID=UPI001C1E5469|nr:DUF2489 domain-containing protein [Hymenobacter siberiensis]
MAKNPPKEVGLLRKFISTARSITTGQVDLSLGILRLEKNLFWLKGYDINPLTTDELKIVNDYYDRIRELPIEEERLAWAPDKLEKLDEKLERITTRYRPQLMEILNRIVTEAS